MLDFIFSHSGRHLGLAFQEILPDALTAYTEVVILSSSSRTVAQRPFVSSSADTGSSKRTISVSPLFAQGKICCSDPGVERVEGVVYASRSVVKVYWSSESKAWSVLFAFIVIFINHLGKTLG